MMSDRKIEMMAGILRPTTLAVVMGLVLSGCGTTTHQTRSADTSGFLQDYGTLRKGEDGESLLVYLNAQTDFSKYEEILIDPIKMYAAQDSKLAAVPPQDRQALLNYLDATLRQQLTKDYKIVTAPGPGVMRLKVAITESKASRVFLDTLSTIMPPGVAITLIKRAAVGSHSAVGLARIEMELHDSQTQVRLAAAVDERAGKKWPGTFDKWKKWQDAQDAYDYWATQLRTRLAELRSGGE